MKIRSIIVILKMNETFPNLLKTIYSTIFD